MHKTENHFPELVENLRKDQKTDVFHIAICKLLEPHGYCIFMVDDTDGWPH